MKTAALFSLVLLALAGTGAAQAQPRLGSNEPVFQSGPWFVVRSTKTGSSTAACTGFYKAHRGIQLSPDALILKFDGHLQQVTVSFNDKPGQPRALRDVEQQMNAVVFSGPDFEQLKKSRKATVDVETDRGHNSQQMALKGINDALENIAAGCPVPDEPLRAGRGKTGSQAAACPPALMARMRANGISEEKIEASCR